MTTDNKDNLAENLLLFLESKETAFFDKFYNSLYPLAFKVSILITKNAADADDVAQTAFYTVFNRLETCQSLQDKDSAKVKSWFLSIVYNQSKLVVRSRVRSKKKEQSQKIKIQTNESKTQMSAYLENQMKVAIDSLDEKYRTPIILKYNEGLKSAEIAYILNVNEETLRVRIRRGLAKVKDLLANDKQEFEKLLPSIGLISFENYSVVPPTPKFVNKDLINTKLLAKKANYSMIKSILISITITGAALFLAYQKIPLAMIKEKPTQNSNIIKLNQKIASQKMEWDFKDSNQNGFFIKNGKWDFVNDGRATTGMIEPMATLITLPIKPDRYFKIQFYGKLEFDAKSDKAPYVARGVLLKNNKILNHKEVLNQFISVSIYPNSGKVEFGRMCYPFEATIYFTKSFIGTRYKKGNKIGSICEKNEADLFDEAGVLIRDFKTQKIEYIPMTEKEAEEIESEMKNNIIKNKK